MNNTFFMIVYKFKEFFFFVFYDFISKHLKKNFLTSKISLKPKNNIIEIMIESYKKLYNLF